jgi:hypothetical protein
MSFRLEKIIIKFDAGWVEMCYTEWAGTMGAKPDLGELSRAGRERCFPGGEPNDHVLGRRPCSTACRMGTAPQHLIVVDSPSAL